MSGVLVVGVAFVTSLLSAQAAPDGLQTDHTIAPTTVGDNRPNFESVNHLGQTANRFQIEVTKFGDASFATPLWSSAPPNGGTAFPSGNVADNTLCGDIPFGTGGNLLNMLLDWNQAYLWHIKFGRNNTWSPFSTTALFTMSKPKRSISQHQKNGSATGPSWRFIGVPIALGTTVPATELLTAVPLLYKLDEPSRTWIQLGPGDTLQGGRGYIGWCDASTVLTLTQGKVNAGIPAVKAGNVTQTPSYDLVNFYTYTNLPVPTGQEITDGQPANAYAGNHLFANPYYEPISWRSSTQPPGNSAFGQMARLGISYAMYKWDGTQYLTYNSQTDTGNAGDIIEPFQAVGIWVQPPDATNNFGNELWIDTPPPVNGGIQKALLAAAPSAPPPPDPDSWHLMMEARSGTAIDTENAFGIDPQADDAWDIRDSEEPGPGTATWVLVSFDHRSDWTKYPRKYTHDFRKTRTKAGDEVVWTFTVDGNTNLPATLTWPNLSDIPATDWKFTLEDPANSASVDLSSVSSYDTLAVNGPSTLTLRATRLKDSPAPPASNGGGGGGGSCGLLGPEGLLLIGWILARRGGRLGRTT